MKTLRDLFGALALLWLSACANPSTSGAQSTTTADAATTPKDAAATDAVTTADAATITAPTEYIATVADFDCVKNGEKVGHFYVANRLGKQAEAVAVAKGNVKGANYPLGTILRLFPLEAMVKRGKGFEETGGWEMFKLTTKGKEIVIEQRGGAEVKNALGTCLGCHAPAKDYDFVCGADHGCEKLEATDELIRVLQDTDARCQP